MTERDKREVIEHIANAHRNAAEQVMAKWGGVSVLMNNQIEEKDADMREARLLLLLADKIRGN